MIMDACSYQRQLLEERIQSYTDTLIKGTASRDEDQRVRGVIQGLIIAKSVVDDVEARARRANAGDESVD